MLHRDHSDCALGNTDNMCHHHTTETKYIPYTLCDFYCFLAFPATKTNTRIFFGSREGWKASQASGFVTVCSKIILNLSIISLSPQCTLLYNPSRQPHLAQLPCARPPDSASADMCAWFWKSIDLAMRTTLPACTDLPVTS
jgi:hypothetical protein